MKKKLTELSKKNSFIFLLSNFLSYKFLIHSGEHYKILNFFTKKKIKIIDVGGSYGESIEAFRKINKNVKIISFEPNKKSFFELKKNFANNKNIKIYNFGIGTKKNNQKIFTPNIYGFNLNSWSSIKKSNLVYNLKKHCGKFFDKFEITEERIKVRYLDDFYLFYPDIIKIDVEGNELDVIKSSSKILLYLKPVIIFELNKKNNSLEKFLLQKGYFFYIVEKNKLLKIKKLKNLNYKETYNIISINEQNQILNEMQIY
jgi:FkbM family methyltransferase